MKKLRLLLFSVIALATNSIFAESRPFDEIQTIANNTLVNSGRVYLNDVKTIDGDTVCYIFKGDNGGYAIVSADTRVPALLAYSNDGEISSELQEMLNIFVQNIDVNQHQNMELAATSSKLRATRITDGPIEPLLKNIAWGQADPFNLNAPTVGSQKSPVGCVATAVAQLLYYYRYPAATISDIPAYTSMTNEINVAGVEKGTKFDWDNMLDTYVNGYTDTQAKAVSDLMSVVDAAVEMDFREEESASNKLCAKELVEYFVYYDDLISVSYRSSYSFEEWSHIIYNELKENRPVLMAGYAMAGGHRFLCDGIDKNGLFHINWGWNGAHDGYYDLAILNPNTTTEVGSSLSTDGYSRNNFIVYGIQPDNGKVDAKSKSSVAEAISVKCQVSDDGYYFLFYSYANKTFEEKTVQLANGYIDEDGNVVMVSSIGEAKMSPLAINNMDRVSNLNVSKFKEGKTYKVGLIESTDGKTWIPCDGFDHVNWTFTVKDGVVRIADMYELSASIEMVDFNAVRQYAHGIIHLNNAGNKEYYNYVYFYSNSVDTLPENISYGAYVTVEAGDDSDVDFKFVPTSDTVYYWLMDVNMNVLDSGAVYKENKHFKLAATLQIDTTDTGDLICRLDVKNEGEAYYDNLVVVSLTHETGFYTIKPELYLKPGDETVISSYIPKEYAYTRYSVYDCYGNLIVFDNMDGSLSHSGEVIVNFTSNRYYTSDQTVVGNLVINNGTSEPHSATYIIELDTTDNFIGRKLASFTVEVPANSSENIPVSLFVGGDTCNLIVYREGELRKVCYTMYAQYDGKTGIEESVAADNSKMRIWSKNAMLVVEAVDDVPLLISTVDGRILVSRRLHKGETFQQNFPSAIYIVNGKKILVR